MGVRQHAAWRHLPIYASYSCSRSITGWPRKNPAKEVRYLKGNSEGFHSWSEEEICAL
jgi:hypothetical protein